MKRALTLLALTAAATIVAHGQTYAAASNPAANGPVNLPGWPSMLDPRPVASPNADSSAAVASETGGRQVEMPTNGKCQGVHYGDIVHFTLRVEGVADAKRVYTQLAMGLGSHPKFVKTDFMLSTADSFGGGGVGKRDAADPQLYHFRFVVPDVRSGIYHAASIGVQAIYSDSSVDEGTGVGLNRRAHEQVKSYCLAVFGGEGGQHRPVVTEFLPGEIERPSTPPERPVFR